MNTPIDAFSDASKLPANPYACFPPKTVGTLNYTRLPTQQRDAKAPSNSEISARDRAVLDARTELFVLRERRSGYRQSIDIQTISHCTRFQAKPRSTPAYFPSYTVFPPTTVRSTLVASTFSGDAAVTSRSSTTKSASIPGTSLPFSFSSNSANAEPVV